MTPDPGQRLSAALDHLQGLSPREVDVYLRRLRDSDPEAANRLRVLLNLSDSAARGTALAAEQTPAVAYPSDEVPLGAPDRGEPISVGVVTCSVDARATASFPPPGASLARTDVPDTPPVGLGRYHLLQVVGRGAFGEVWKAFDPVLQKHVAVKFSRPDRSIPVEAFLDEARKAASLPRHPAIVHVYDVGATADGWYIISEFIDGESLRSRMAAGLVPIEQAVRMVATVAGALHTAHLAGLVHRDVKPANILLDRAGHAYLTDFGLAVREEDQFAERSKVSGTLAYMPPEQISGDTHLLDGRADIYALGAVFYELLTGRPLFRATDVEDYRELILRREPRPPRAVDANVPEELERICLKCLAKEVKDRYRTAQDVAAELEAWLASTGRFPVPVRPAPRARWWKWVSVGVVLALTVGAISVALHDRGRPAPIAQAPPVAPPAAPVLAMQAPAKKVPAVKELLWISANPRNEWKALGDTNQLKVSSESPALLQLGVATEPNWEFAATFEQNQDVGGVGLFYGHQPEGKLSTFEMASLVWFRDRVDPAERIQLQQSTEGYIPDVPTDGVHGCVLTGAWVRTRPAANTIRVKIRGGILSEVHFNGELVLVAKPRNPRRAAGGFGLYNNCSDTLVSQIKVNDNPVRLLVDPVPPAPERP